MAIEQVVKDFQKDLVGAADAFLATGLHSLHKRNASQSDMQVALVNSAIGCELLIKGLLVKLNPTLALLDLAPEDMISFHAPKSFFKGRRSNSEIKLKFREFKTREFSDCVNFLFALQPEVKIAFGSSLQRMPIARNGGAHSAVAADSLHDVERTAYVALKLFEAVGKDAGSQFAPTKRDEEFLEKFDTERSERVRKKLEAARRQSHSKEFKELSADAEGWEQLSFSCRVCGCDGVMTGATENDIEGLGPDDYNESLTFNGASFSCGACGLDLEDEEELRLAGIEATQDRSGDLEQWHADTSGFDIYEDR